MRDVMDKYKESNEQKTGILEKENRNDVMVTKTKEQWRENFLSWTNIWLFSLKEMTNRDIYYACVREREEM